MEKILISGTGRCGTTFLMKIFILLGFDTGFSSNNYLSYVFDNCNAGLEKSANSPYRVTKSPFYMGDIDEIARNKEITIKYFIIPLRDYREAALSRAKHGANPGGLWEAENADEQELFYYGLIARYVIAMARYDIPTVFLDFDRMTQNREYLYDKLKDIFEEKGIGFDAFNKAYLEAERTSRRD